jgi:endoribonuclease LACTB2
LFLKKKATEGQINGVSYLNGQVSFQNVSLNVYSFLVDGVLIDTGSRSLHKYFEPFILEADCDKVMLTHHHEDHTGCAAFIEKTRKIPIYLDEKTIEYCRQTADYPLYRQLFWGRRKPFSAQPIPSSFTSRNAVWEVIETPGHAHDHRAFLNKETGQLFTGDLFVNEKIKVALAEENIPQTIQSLERVLSYDFQDVYCNHAGYVEEGRTALGKKLENLLSIQDQVLTLYKQGNTTQEIHTKLFPKKYPIHKFSGGEWDSLHIITSILKGNLQEF